VIARSSLGVGDRRTPDKVADQVSDAVLDAILAQDPFARVAVKRCSPRTVRRGGRDLHSAYVDINHLARQTIIGIGYDDGRWDLTSHGRSCGHPGLARTSRVPTSPRASTWRSNNDRAPAAKTC